MSAFFFVPFNGKLANKRAALLRRDYKIFEVADSMRLKSLKFGEIDIVKGTN